MQGGWRNRKKKSRRKEYTGRYNKIKKDIGRKRERERERESYGERGKKIEWRFWGCPENHHRCQCMSAESYSRKWWSRNKGDEWNDCNISEKTWRSEQNEGRTVKIPNRTRKKEKKYNWQSIFENEEKLM